MKQKVLNPLSRSRSRKTELNRWQGNNRRRKPLTIFPYLSIMSIDLEEMMSESG